MGAPLGPVGGPGGAGCPTSGGRCASELGLRVRDAQNAPRWFAGGRLSDDRGSGAGHRQEERRHVSGPAKAGVHRDAEHPLALTQDIDGPGAMRGWQVHLAWVTQA